MSSVQSAEQRVPPSLATIPPELLSNIALHLSLTPSPRHPPSNLLPLLLLSKHFNNHLSLSQNPRLYSRIFKAKYDTAAISRRFGYDGTRSRFLAVELQRRTAALERLGKATRSGDVTAIDEQDLWVPYLMIIENDGKNLAHLLTPGARFHLPTFISLYQEQHLVTAAILPGYPPSTVGRALALWIGWLLSGHGQVTTETPEQIEERLFVLRPYVFAAQEYDLYFAPWTIPHLPLNVDQISPADPNPFVADLAPRSHLVTIPFGDQTLSICPPNLSQAATLQFFLPREANQTQNGTQPTPLSGPLDTPWSATGLIAEEKGEDADGQVDPEQEAIAELVATQVTEPVSVERQCSMDITVSKGHDRDFKRLTSCWDPRSSAGMRAKDWRGSWDGCWEGTFSFFDFDAFREMLSGQMRSLYEGEFGQQAQVWRLKETYVRKVRSRAYGKRKAESIEETVTEEASADEPKVLSGPALNAGFPTIAQPAGPGLASAAAEAESLRITVKEQIEALDGYEEVPEDELDEMCNAADGGEAEGLTILLTGTGHSSWGRFVLKGKVRAWDGMATLVKQYFPDGRGRWIYRGYVLAGGLFVGRWRDTFTPEEYVGYEGTFNFSRRQDE